MSATLLQRDGHVYLEWAGTSLLVDASGGGVPRFVHFGAALGITDAADLAGAIAAVPAWSMWINPDSISGVSPVLEARAGWSGLPGLVGHRGERGPASSLRLQELAAATADGDDGIRMRLVDAEQRVALVVEAAALPTGLLALTAELTNEGDDLYELDSLRLSVPIPIEADELLDFTGHWAAERHAQRRPLGVEAVLRENRRGRTGHDSATLLIAGPRGFGFDAGEIWGAHLGWSGDSQLAAQRENTGVGALIGGELLAPGEIRLAPGETYRTPVLYAGHAIGLDALAHRFQQHLLDRHPVLLQKPRPVTVNSWEAVYFEQTPATLYPLIEKATAVGAERFVVDDGWFTGRTDDHRALGDWTIDERKWPGESFRELADHVHAAGMEFGLWFEPEMVNPDSELARAHPDWILGTPDRKLLEFRQQAVLNLADPQAFAHLLETISARVAELGIDYIKWDHNRDLVDAVDARTLQPRVHEQTLAAYRLMDELQRRHPGLEIEACASGGSRIDLGVLDRTQRMWVSDNNDPLERQTIQRWTTQLTPLAMQGAHVPSPVSHTTGRFSTLEVRAISAMFGHFGIEWDLTSTTDEETAELAGWVALHKKHRALIHGGLPYRVQHPDATISGTVVVARDGSEALLGLVKTDISSWAPTSRIRVPGLDATASYRVELALPNGAAAPVWPNAAGHPREQWPPAGLVARGSALSTVGLTLPVMWPSQAALLHLTRA